MRPLTPCHAAVLHHTAFRGMAVHHHRGRDAEPEGPLYRGATGTTAQLLPQLDEAPSCLTAPTERELSHLPCSDKQEHHGMGADLRSGGHEKKHLKQAPIQESPRIHV